MGISTLKPGSLSEFHGEKAIERAYVWIEAAERVLIQRANETFTTDTTERWGACAIDYLKGHAAEWAHLQWSLNTNIVRNGLGAPSYIVDWHQFKTEFIAQFVPADAVSVLQKQFEDLAVTGSVRTFNDAFRLICMRLRMATKEPTPALGIGSDPQTIEANRNTTAIAEAVLVNKYGLMLQRAAEEEARKGRLDGPMMRVYTKYTERMISNADKTPPYIPTLGRMMSYMETMDTIINHRNLKTGLDSTPVNTGYGTTAFQPMQTNTNSSTGATTAGEEVMDWEATNSKSELRFNALFEKAMKSVKDGRRRCYHCNKPGHAIKDCWERNGGGSGDKGKGRSSGGFSSRSVKGKRKSSISQDG